MIILDGGTGTLVQTLGAPMDGETWCADANLTHPDLVREAHRQYLAAGAEVLIANTYATSPLLFNHLGRDSDVTRIDAAAVNLAREASDGTVPVAGSFSVMRPGIPGSDRSHLLRGWSEPEARRLFAAKAAGLVDAGADVIAMEMMRDGDYSVWATEAAVATGLPVWVGIAVEEVEEGRLTGFGRPNWLLEDFVDPLLGCAPAMVSVMHSSPPVTTTALGVVREHWRGSLGAYAESGYFAMPDWQFIDIIPEAEYVALAQRWAEAFDLSMIGGCCGIGPSHIAALREAFPRSA
ncbi:MAG TPA: homocysteine S-methyltransferase family protein [Ilumatobacteraceae bacterium]|nr:homocysteine S-methyltransferase family protein [Ilumatobacteraceae bacterium]